MYIYLIYPVVMAMGVRDIFSCRHGNGGLIYPTVVAICLGTFAAKQSRIKSIAWHLRWLVRTRADISLRPSGLARPRTDIKLRPSTFVRTRTDFKLQTVGLGRSYKD